MPIRDILKRKESNADRNAPIVADSPPQHPKFTFIRSTTDSQEIISPPHYPGDVIPPVPELQKSPVQKSPVQKSRRHSLFHREHNENGSRKSLSEKLNWNRSRSASSSSANIPSNLPAEPKVAYDAEGEAEWEQRATILVKSTAGSRPTTPQSDKKKPVSDDPSDVRLKAVE
jgi:hypothetical protein